MVVVVVVPVVEVDGTAATTVCVDVGAGGGGVETTWDSGSDTQPASIAIAPPTRIREADFFEAAREIYNFVFMTR